MKAAECEYRFAYKTRRKDGTVSHRITYCCKERSQDGYLLKHWKCVGADSPDCPKLKEPPCK